MLQPSASNPPSAKKSACTISTEATTRNAACGPRRIASSRPPPRWPLDPVPGILKLIICAANRNAPSTPISGTRRSSPSRRTWREHQATVAAVTTPIVPPTAGESSASAMCIASSPIRHPAAGSRGGRRRSTRRMKSPDILTPIGSVPDRYLPQAAPGQTTGKVVPASHAIGPPSAGRAVCAGVPTSHRVLPIHRMEPGAGADASRGCAAAAKAVVNQEVK